MSRTKEQVIKYMLIILKSCPAVRVKGYNAFNEKVFTDHRCMYIKVDINIFVGDVQLQLANEALRKIWSKDPNSLKIYVKRWGYLTKSTFWKNDKLSKKEQLHNVPTFEFAKLFLSN